MFSVYNIVQMVEITGFMSTFLGVYTIFVSLMNCADRLHELFQNSKLLILVSADGYQTTVSHF